MTAISDQWQFGKAAEGLQRWFAVRKSRKFSWMAAPKVRIWWQLWLANNFCMPALPAVMNNEQKTMSQKPKLSDFTANHDYFVIILLFRLLLVASRKCIKLKMQHCRFSGKTTTILFLYGSHISVMDFALRDWCFSRTKIIKNKNWKTSENIM